MPVTLNMVIVVRPTPPLAAATHSHRRVCLSLSALTGAHTHTRIGSQDGAEAVPMEQACTPDPDKPMPDSTPMCLGIDEAGRGAALGDMTYGVAWCPVDKKEECAKLGFMDSKMLNDKNRSTLLKIMDDCEYMHWAVDILQPYIISGQMLQQERYNLNAISHDSAIGLIRLVIALGYNLTELYVDTVGIQETYEKKLQMLFPNVACTVRKKADSIYPIVSAASIGAKVTRDRRLESVHIGAPPPGEIFYEESPGSGYPGDPATKKWLSENVQEFWGLPSCTRFSWRPVKDLVAEQCVEVDYGVIEEDEEDAAEARKATGGGIAQFFGGTAANRSSKRVRGTYFSDRGMHVCDDF